MGGNLGEGLKSRGKRFKKECLKMYLGICSDQVWYGKTRRQGNDCHEGRSFYSGFPRIRRQGGQAEALGEAPEWSGGRGSAGKHQPEPLLWEETGEAGKQTKQP